MIPRFGSSAKHMLLLLLLFFTNQFCSACTTAVLTRGGYHSNYCNHHSHYGCTSRLSFQDLSSGPTIWLGKVNLCFSFLICRNRGKNCSHFIRLFWELNEILHKWNLKIYLAHHKDSRNVNISISLPFFHWKFRN